ncbi:hypothetical protein IC232_11450 [Microvirga sp. BT688]|uniref:hypothetical protein n=1 Tax=Microvirga sp. TaxID=1873136 RepID=UPI001684BF5A|nr:hypothetical protein [Microvirga sp.]MBD2747307.1 hypothetical protein [Microvirga sp.]
MAEALYSGAAASRNHHCGPSAASTTLTSNDVGRVSPLPAAMLSPMGSPDGVTQPDHDSDARATLLAVASQANVVTLADLVSAIPNYPQPLSAVLALVDRGFFGVDLESPFGPDLLFWRLRP